MKSLILAVAAVAGVTAGVWAIGAARAEEKPAAKEVKLTGTLVCGKCNLKITTKCSNALQVKEGDKTVNYFLDDKGAAEPYHEEVCGDGKIEGVNVAGTVSEKDGQKWVKVTKFELPKKK